MLVEKNLAEDKNNKSYSQIESCFKHLLKDDTLQRYVSQTDFINNVKAAGAPTDDIGYSLFVFGMRNHENFWSAQS